MQNFLIRLKYAWKCFVLGWKNEKRKEAIEMFERLNNVSQANIEYINKGTDIVNLYSTDDELDVDFAIASMHRLRDQLIRTLGNEGYGENLNVIEPDLAMAYKEADYQIARADYLDAELQYYKAANNPNGPQGNMLKVMWDHRCELKERLDVFEAEAAQAVQN